MQISIEMRLDLSLPENTIRFSLEYEFWRNQWKAFSLVDMKTERKWYKGEGFLPQEAIDDCSQNMLSGKSLDTFYSETPLSVTKGSIAIERIKHEREKEQKNLEDIF